jgi:hypothetical protein
MRRFLEVCLVTLALLFCLSSVHAQNPAQNLREDLRRLLKGVQGVNLVVIVPNEENYKKFSRYTLQRDLEIRLRKSGIKVGTEYPALNVLIILSSEPVLTNCGEKAEVEMMYSVTVSVTIGEKTRLVRDPTLTAFASTWNSLQGFITEEKRLKDEVGERLADTMDEFINDYLAANPK